MRLDLNLATQPYEDVRDFLIKWGSAVGVALIASIVVVWLAVSGWRQSQDVDRDMSAKRQEIARLKGDEQHAQKLLELPQNSGTRAQAALLNALFARKAFSWTQAFADFEKLMPARVRVVSIQPQLDPDNQLSISLVIAADSRDKAIDLLKNLEDSKHFQDARLISEANDPEGKGTRFQLSAVYIPETLQPARATSSGGVQ
jgi:type IV pilus assembly protein PilN